MFTCTLEPASRTPLCEQLYTALKREMERGGIRPGERMPSKRELAAHLSVSTATVEAAYARLISEGLCESRPRSGIYSLEQTPNVGAAPGENRLCAGISARARRTRHIFRMPHGRG